MGKLSFTFYQIFFILPQRPGRTPLHFTRLWGVDHRCFDTKSGIMEIQKKIYTFDSVVRLIITLTLLYLFVRLLAFLSDVLVPFAIALLLAYLINPLVLLVQKKIKNRLIAVLISLVVVVSVCGILAWIFIPIIINEIAHMGRIISDLVTKSELAEKAARRLPPDLWQAIKDLVSLEQVQQIFATDNMFQIANSVA